MKKRLMFLALAAMGLASCNGGFKKGEAGMLYDIVVDKGGPKIQTGDFVSVNLTLKTDADSVIGSTYDNGIPAMQMWQKPPQKGDIVTGIDLLSEGDSAVIKVNIDSLSKGRPRPAGMKGKYQVYTVKIEKVIAKGNLSDQVFQGRVQAYYTAVVDAAKKLAKSSEPVKIKKYIDDNKLNVTKTDSGLYYVITKPGSGVKAVVGDTVVVNYTLKLVSGKAVETSVKADAIKYKMQLNPMTAYKPIHFAIGTKGMIKGWDQGMQLLNKGAKATFIIPSSLAYGDHGNQQIQPYSTLIFDIELVDIIHPNPNAPKPVATIPPVQARLQPVKPVTK
jgi:FKBP-type peptidyl-prolyl cis-trans isomerase FkpA